MTIHSHYDNLRLPRDATADQIRSSYRTLAARFHPDRNPGDAEAERIMKLLNKAYEVLSDPARRQNHDDWIRQAELAADEPWRPLHPVPPPDTEHDNFVSCGFAPDDELPGQFTRARQTWGRRGF